MKNINNKFNGVLLQFIGTNVMSSGNSVETVARQDCVMENPNFKKFFCDSGIEASHVTSAAVTLSLTALGLNVRGSKSFAEMLTLLTQFSAGSLTVSDLIIALQCTSAQMLLLVLHSRMILTDANKTSIAGWDDDSGVINKSPSLSNQY